MRVTRYMNDNQLATLPASLFNTMASLQDLRVSSNAITHLHAFNSQPLRTIDFSSNNIGTIAGSAFSSLTNLQSV